MVAYSARLIVTQAHSNDADDAMPLRKRATMENFCLKTPGRTRGDIDASLHIMRCSRIAVAQLCNVVAFQVMFPDFMHPVL